MLSKLRDHWKPVILWTLGLAALGTLAWAWEAKQEIDRPRSRDTGLTTLDPDALRNELDTTRGRVANWPFTLGPGIDPFDSLLLPFGNLQSPADSLWTRMPGVGGSPNTRTLSDRVVIELAIPDLNEASLQIEADRQSLRVTAQQETAQEERDASGRVVSTSRSSSTYATRFGLPEPVQPDGLTSRYEGGVLYIEIPRLYKEH